MKTLVITIVFIFSILHSFSQTANIYGRIIDQNKHPIESATIQGTTSKSKYITLTDENGQFKFLSIPSDSIIINAKYLNYYQVDTNFNLSNGDTNWLTITLTPNTLVADTEYVWFGFGAERAKYDINRNYIRILLTSGLILHRLPSDKEFEEKYKVTFYNQCLHVDKKSMTKYNLVVFKHLDKTFGKQWRKEVRQDIVGLKK
jgi:hypothetical protein